MAWAVCFYLSSTVLLIQQLANIILFLTVSFIKNVGSTKSFIAFDGLHDNKNYSTQALKKKMHGLVVTMGFFLSLSSSVCVPDYFQVFLDSPDYIPVYIYMFPCSLMCPLVTSFPYAVSCCSPRRPVLSCVWTIIIKNEPYKL